jgi:hypothetical protein
MEFKNRFQKWNLKIDFKFGYQSQLQHSFKNPILQAK